MRKPDAAVSLALVGLVALAGSAGAQSGPTNGSLSPKSAPQNDVRTLTSRADENEHHDQIIEVIDSDDRMADAEHRERIAQLEAAPTPLKPQHIADEDRYYANLKQQISLKRMMEDLRHQQALGDIERKANSSDSGGGDAGGGGSPAGGGNPPPNPGQPNLPTAAELATAKRDADHYEQELRQYVQEMSDENARHQQRLAQLEAAPTPLKPQHIADENEHHDHRIDEITAKLQVTQSLLQLALQRSGQAP